MHLDAGGARRTDFRPQFFGLPQHFFGASDVGARRGDDKSWLHALSRRELIDAVHDNLRNLGVDRLDVVNLRVGGVIGAVGGIDRGAPDRTC